MRHALIHKKAKLLDSMIENYRDRRGRKTFPHRELGSVIRFLFPGSSISGKGMYKSVHKISSRARDLVLKTGNAPSIQNEMRVYRRIPPTLRNWHYAKIYWRTKHCLLQKYGKKARVPSNKLKELKLLRKSMAWETCGLRILEMLMVD